ncbi:putative Plant invertase/pectin methylesterase inhibitor superfamily protein [Hibiscus syriacus]|uniref:Plant invertase/pectin methylesterase inhibitor superfamily protein n=1 Tax=Hibiscus syriacus TaxID=106335 RepID=A0A6A2Y5M6_HIBSY|nr:putative Plant invertase/pectin methylesterase inhibitor superfamily protein [Hibiscus syriacus]
MDPREKALEFDLENGVAVNGRGYFVVPLLPGDVSSCGSVLSHKKPPKPPRPPSLDAADQKIIKEIAELARLKHARIERIKALKKMKAAEGTSSRSNNVLVRMSSGGRPTSYEESPVPAGAGALNRGLISVQFSEKPAAMIPNQPDSGSPYLVEQVAGLDAQEKLKRSSG